MKNMLKPLALSALVVLISMSAAFAQTPEASVLRVTDPLDVGGTLLQPGVYTIRVLPSFESRNQIQITSPDLKTVFATVLTVPHYVVPNEETPNTTFVFYPTADGQSAALRTWYAAFPDASQGGHDIVYSKSRAEQLARLSHSNVVSYQDQTAVANLNTVPLQVVTPEATVETYTPPPVASVATTETTTETTSTTSAPMTSAAMTPAPEAPTEVADSAPADMPRTASNTPLLALLGLAAIGGAIVLRFGRSI